VEYALCALSEAAGSLFSKKHLIAICAPHQPHLVSLALVGFVRVYVDIIIIIDIIIITFTSDKNADQ